MLFNRGGLSARRDLIDLVGRMNTTAAGVITTQTKKKFSGFVAARTGAGLYTLTVEKTAAKYAELIDVDARIILAAIPAANGVIPFVTSDLVTTTGVITVQFRQASGAAAELMDNATVLWTITLGLSASQVA